MFSVRARTNWKKHVAEFKIICITRFYKCIILQVPLSFCSLTSSSCKARWWMNQAEILEVSRCRLATSAPHRPWFECVPTPAFEYNLHAMFQDSKCCFAVSHFDATFAKMWTTSHQASHIPRTCVSAASPFFAWPEAWQTFPLPGKGQSESFIRS